MKNNKLISIILASSNFVICMLLLIFLTPSSVPLISGIHDEVIVIGSKWWMLFGAILPLILMTVYLLTKHKETKFITTSLIIFIFYNNLLAFSYFIAGEKLAIGSVSEVPISAAIFLPLSLWLFVYGVNIKNLEYKNKFGICSKNTKTTEFIWKQIHFSASYYFRLSALILFIISIVFCFIRYPLIELVIFILVILTTRIILEIQAKKMSKKYKDMKQKQDKLSKNKAKE